MKILHISHLYHPSKGGVQTWFKNVSERLVRDYGDEVTVITTDSLFGPERRLYQKAGPAEEIVKGVKVRRFSYRRWHLKYSSLFFRVLRKLTINPSDEFRVKAIGPYSKPMWEFLMSAKADAICASSSAYYFMQLPLYRKCNFFYFGSLHIPEDESKPIINSLQLKSINASKFYLANTHFEKRKLIAAGVIPEKIKVLGVGVDPKDLDITSSEKSNFRTEHNIPTDAIIIGYVGRIEKPKNVAILLESFLQLAEENSNIYLLIAGLASDYTYELQQSCKAFSSSISDRIVWKLDFAANQKPAIFHNIDVLVLPSNNESFGIVFLEAWTCKKPVVGSGIGAVRDVISSEVDGLLMEPDNTSSLSSQLKRLIDSKELRTSLGEAGHKKVITNYTWDIITKNLRNLYLEAQAEQSNFSRKTTACLEKNLSGSKVL